MSENVLTTASSVECGHGGAVGVVGEPTLKVGGSPVLLRAGIEGRAMSRPCPTPPSEKSKPCVRATEVTAGEAGKLKVGEAGVMLESLAGETDGELEGDEQALLKASANQTKLKVG